MLCITLKKKKKQTQVCEMFSIFKKFDVYFSVLSHKEMLLVIYTLIKQWKFTNLRIAFKSSENCSLRFISLLRTWPNAILTLAAFPSCSKRISIEQNVHFFGRISAKSFYLKIECITFQFEEITHWNYELLLFSAEKSTFWRNYLRNAKKVEPLAPAISNTLTQSLLYAMVNICSVQST